MAAADRHRPDLRKADRALGYLSDALEAAGWSAVRGPAAAGEIHASRGNQRLPIELRFAREPRRSMLQALLADAILSGRARVGERRRFLAIVGAPAISPAMASSLEAYVREVAPDQPFGYVDERGLVRLHGAGLEDARHEPAPQHGSRVADAQPRDLFSDMNQWMLKVLVARPLPDEMISVPREAVRAAAALAQRAGASMPAAWRLVSALRAAGHLDEAGHVVRLRDLFARWRAAALRPQREVGAAWILPGRSPLERLRRALADMARHEESPAACLGLFAACDALGVGHVRGAPVHVYVRRAEPGQLERLGLAIVEQGRAGDVVVRVARWPESLFRAAVGPHGVPVSDVIQCWLDVSSHPARGSEQAAFIWKRVLGPALVAGEPQP